MAMGSAGMAEMGEMEMPLPDNTLPMMTGFGQFGPMEMGGMFTVVKVREGLAADDYRDPGWYTASAGHRRLRVWRHAGAAGPPHREPARSGASRNQRRQTTQFAPSLKENEMKMTSRPALIVARMLATAGVCASSACTRCARGGAQMFSAGEPGDPKKPARDGAGHHAGRGRQDGFHPGSPGCEARRTGAIRSAQQRRT